MDMLKNKSYALIKISQIQFMKIRGYLPLLDAIWENPNSDWDLDSSSNSRDPKNKHICILLEYSILFFDPSLFTIENILDTGL